MTYQLSPTGIYQPLVPVAHRDDEYNQTGFGTLWDMQERDFWNRSRHRFLLKALDRFVPKTHSPLWAVDLGGGGAGGWVRYLADRRGEHFQKIALADSSQVALTMVGNILPPGVDRYPIDLMNLGWEDEWDVAFMC